MTPTDLQPGDVVQIDPATAERNGFFGGCFMLVTEPKAFGAQGFIAMPGERGSIPGEAYCHAKWDEMEFVGRATWVPKDDEEETPA